jgi:tetratricopeptide (TPR) repeat protein
MECWVGAARALKKMYEISGASDYYKQASQAYSAAVEITPSVIEIWIEKLELCLNFSKDLKSCEPLYTVLNDCRRASFYFLNQATNPPSDPTSLMYARFLMVWAEILSVLGEKKDRIDFIREAENKIMEALNLSREDDSFLDMQQGKCLFSFAVFFHDVDLYYQAVEQFQKALSRKRSDAEGWFWMGRTYAALSSLTDEIDHLEKSLRFYQKSLQLKHHFRIYFEFAKMLIQKAEIDGQVEHIEQSIQYLEYLLHQNQALSYENPEWFFQYGVALDIMGQLRDETGYYKRALEALTTALMLSPQNSAIHHRIGIVYSHLGEVIDEIDYFYRSLQHLKLAAQDEEENDQIYVDWGVTWMHLSEYACDETTEKTCFAEAEQKFLFACNLGNRSAFYQLACLYSLQKEFEQSVYYLLKAHYYNTLPPLEEIQDDAWLEDVRLSHHFQEFLALLQKS